MAGRARPLALPHAAGAAARGLAQRLQRLADAIIAGGFRRASRLWPGLLAGLPPDPPSPALVPKEAEFPVPVESNLLRYCPSVLFLSIFSSFFLYILFFHQGKLTLVVLGLVLRLLPVHACSLLTARNAPKGRRASMPCSVVTWQPRRRLSRQEKRRPDTNSSSQF